MRAAVGDRMVVASQAVDRPVRDGEVIEVRGPDGSGPFLCAMVGLWVGDLVLAGIRRPCRPRPGHGGSTGPRRWAVMQLRHCRTSRRALLHDSLTSATASPPPARIFSPPTTAELAFRPRPVFYQGHSPDRRERRRGRRTRARRWRAERARHVPDPAPPPQQAGGSTRRRFAAAQEPESGSIVHTRVRARLAVIMHVRSRIGHPGPGAVGRSPCVEINRPRARCDGLRRQPSPPCASVFRRSSDGAPPRLPGAVQHNLTRPAKSSETACAAADRQVELLQDASMITGRPNPSRCCALRSSSR